MKRSRSSSPDSWPKSFKESRRRQGRSGLHPGNTESAINDGSTEKKEHESFAREQTRLNQIQETEQMREWVSKEDDFVLKQSKKKAHIRVREGRAKFIDWLAVTLSVIDTTTDPLEDESDDPELDIVDPAGVFEGLSLSQLQDLGKDIDAYSALESNGGNRRYWNALSVICTDHQTKVAPTGSSSRSVQTVSGDIDRLLTPKTLKQLDALETQIAAKLRSIEPIDVEYWEQLRNSIAVYKAKAELNEVYKAMVDSRLVKLRQQQALEAMEVKEKLALLLTGSNPFSEFASSRSVPGNAASSSKILVSYSRQLDPEPLKKLRSEDRVYEVITEADFVNKVALERLGILRLGYVPLRQSRSDKPSLLSVVKPTETPVPGTSRFATVLNEDFSQATTALYEREVARGVQENEEIFAGEEEVSSLSKPQWANKYRPRKPRYFNRVQMGYEWNKYNQTHYDHDNPPPKVVQGYKFNIFYPDLIDKVKAPTYRIERENGRKRGQSFAPAGEEDTCLIRFISGPPYEDVAFRIVDKEWDYSAKRERGFRSSFDKVYYRK
ncbi:hypothetical protein MMC07_003560 [Pseudocyphellaria aurata]|nr:hypothetical protein [Pseudocyphellaria aurata]